MIKLDSSVEGFINYATARFMNAYEQYQRENQNCIDLTWGDLRDIIVNHLLGATSRIKLEIGETDNNAKLMKRYLWQYEKYFALNKDDGVDEYAKQAIEWLDNRVTLNLNAMFKFLKGDEYSKTLNMLVDDQIFDTRNIDEQLRIVRTKYPWIKAKAFASAKRSERGVAYEDQTYLYYLILGITIPMPQWQQKESLKEAIIEVLWQKYHNLMKSTSQKGIDRTSYIKGIQGLISDQQWQELFAPLAV